ncbi:uncharacterized protein LOC111354563 [Spodoptera litura]|uniref:Uncharacterized protein LOC111354563 n=1 Tax=Spodoptera litura TaxID=69820 RepID=A0A9J7E3R5_SPOLT|nr:uncharacterized protein LOC111354563 [Spodoptera litura]
MFQQFFNDDEEEWHLRNAIKHKDDYYHPLCFEDYRTSLTKAGEPKVKDIASEAKVEEEGIETKDVDETAEQSDNESVVEVIEDPKELDPVEIDDEDDVVFLPEPVVEVVVEDDAETDDELTAERAERDRLAEIDFSKIKVKQEPIDHDDEPIVTAEEETIPTRIDHTNPTVESSIDGNFQLDAVSIPAASIPIGGIRINISKSFVTKNREEKILEDVSAGSEPLPPSEEPELEHTLKPALQGVQFGIQPPVNQGNELSGLCSIM